MATTPKATETKPVAPAVADPFATIVAEDAPIKTTVKTVPVPDSIRKFVDSLTVGSRKIVAIHLWDDKTVNTFKAAARQAAKDRGLKLRIVDTNHKGEEAIQISVTELPKD